MAEVVAKLGVKRESGFLYFLRGSDVFKTPMKRAGGPAVAGQEQKVVGGNFHREEGFLYFLDKNGNVARAKRAVGGQKRKKVKRTANKKVTAKGKKPAAKKAATTAQGKKPAAKKATTTQGKKPVAKKGAKKK